MGADEISTSIVHFYLQNEHDLMFDTADRLHGFYRFHGLSRFHR